MTTVTLATPGAAQLVDLQPGPNFPTAEAAFGTGRSENIAVGDVDRDGDLDVVVGNGGDGSSQPNQLHLNAGAAQGGTMGSFLDVSATHLAGQVLEATRDVELVDWDGDFDLDLFEANKGYTGVLKVQRAYRNQGGLQLGTVGTYLEATDDFWGALVSIPPADEVGVQDGFGPFRHFEGSDADFADLDDDGDLDLVLASPGPNFAAVRPSLVFLNDGTGLFHELWPWADAAAQTKLTSTDFDLADLDGDYDLDLVATSRDSQSRIFRNNLADDGWSDTPFTDVTQTALIDTLAQQQPNSCYEVEIGDLDGDDDFDLWMVNYQGWGERLLLNEGDLAFSKNATAIVGDPGIDEHDAELIDFDGDGDLDVFLANFSGTNWLYQSGLDEGLSVAGGLYHRTGTASGGSQAPWTETPLGVSGGTSLGAEAFDMDGDGDPDLLLANDANQPNRYLENVLGVPDTHAPVLRQLTVQADKSDGSPTPIHVRVMDNAGMARIALHDARLVWSVDGGPETCWPMLCQGGQLFRSEIPAGLTGAISYRVEVTDDAGNTTVSATTTYQQSGGTPDLWLPVDTGTVGVAGRPLLVLEGSQVPGQPVFLQLVDGAPDGLCLLVAGVDSTPVLFKGGLLYPVPWVLELILPTDAAGMLNLLTTWPAGLPAGTETWFQCAVADPLNPTGASLSNAVRGLQP